MLMPSAKQAQGSMVQQSIRKEKRKHPKIFMNLKDSKNELLKVYEMVNGLK